MVGRILTFYDYESYIIESVHEPVSGVRSTFCSFLPSQVRRFSLVKRESIRCRQPIPGREVLTPLFLVEPVKLPLLRRQNL